MAECASGVSRISTSGARLALVGILREGAGEGGAAGAAREVGGRGVYFKDPNGHLLEIITRPYGSEA